GGGPAGGRGAGGRDGHVLLVASGDGGGRRRQRRGRGGRLVGDEALPVPVPVQVEPADAALAGERARNVVDSRVAAGVQVAGDLLGAAEAAEVAGAGNRVLVRNECLLVPGAAGVVA